jgi:hypothetical protein
MSDKHDLEALLRTLSPVLREGRWVFVRFDRRPPFDAEVAASIREGSAMSAVVAESEAARLNLEHGEAWAWLECPLATSGDTGVTSVLTTALARSAIPCKVIAGIDHDHLFVPFDQRADALATLDELTIGKARPRASGTHVARGDGLAEVVIQDGEIRLGQFLKLAGLVDSGAAVKPLLAYGRVHVNGESESRRGSLSATSSPSMGSP